MGAELGVKVGNAVGTDVGLGVVGKRVGEGVGSVGRAVGRVGNCVGTLVGYAVGVEVVGYFVCPLRVGHRVGNLVGFFVGNLVGFLVGCFVGTLVGFFVGNNVGEGGRVGDFVGKGVPGTQAKPFHIHISRLIWLHLCCVASIAQVNFVGETVGFFVGNCDGSLVGKNVGNCVGNRVGQNVGASVHGTHIGPPQSTSSSQLSNLPLKQSIDVGFCVGKLVGSPVG